jgi:nuclease HARBI1
MAHTRCLYSHFIYLKVMHELLRLLPFAVEEEDRILMMLTIHYEAYTLGARVSLPKVTPSSFLDEEFVNIFRFSKTDFRGLVTLFQFEEEVEVNYRYKVSGEECLLILLCRLSYPGRLCQLSRVFHRSKAALSTIFNHALAHVHEKTKHLLTFDPHRLSGEYFNRMARLNRTKCPLLPNCIGYIDGTVRPICKPSRDQRVFYNGHKRVHALKFHNILFPDGMIVYMDGPYPGRDHDAGLLHRSGLDTALEHHLLVGGRQYHLYGDSGYPLRPYLLRPHGGASLTRQQLASNAAMSTLRTSVEWSFGKVSTLFAFVDFKKNAKLQLQPVGKYYLVATVLANCHTCLYGSQVNTFFNSQPPPIDEYLNLQ